MSEIQDVIEGFASKLAALIEGQALERARAAVVTAFGHGAKRGRPPKARSFQESVPEVATKKARRKGPRQLCPVPGCKNPAAPVFGMVCADHKGVAKTKIKKYREQRRAKKLGLAGVRAASRKAPKKAKKRKPVASSPKPAPAAAATATA